MILVLKDAKIEEQAKTFCLTVQREFAVRAGKHDPKSVQERRWLQEGIRPIEQFETVGDMLAEGLCK